MTRCGKLRRGAWPWVALTAVVLAGLYLAVTRGGELPGTWVAPMVNGSAWPGGGRLFLGSLGLAAVATALAVLLAFPVGVCLGYTRRASLAATALIPIVIPPHLAAYVWRFTLEDIFGAAAGALWRSPTGSFLGAAWTLAALYWPVIALPIAVVLCVRGNRLDQELATLAPPRAVFWRAVLPGLAPGIVAGAGIVFLLALSNFGVPLMWNIPSQNVAVFARLAAYYRPAEALVLSLPLLATAAACCGAAMFWLAKRPYGLDLSSAALPERGALRVLSTAAALPAVAVLLVTAGILVASLASSPELLREIRSDFVAGWPPYLWGLTLAALGATGATAAGMILAQVMRRAGRAVAWTVEAIGLCALFMPAAIVCLILAGTLSGGRWTAVLYDSLWVFVLAYGIRFFYLPWKITRFVQRFEGREHEDLRRLLGLGFLSRIRLAAGGILRPALTVSWLVVFALALGELEIASFLVQPGRQPVGVFLDNLMHYGRSAAVVQWSLVVILTEVVIAWVVLSVGMLQWRRLRAMV